MEFKWVTRLCGRCSFVLTISSAAWGSPDTRTKQNNIMIENLVLVFTAIIENSFTAIDLENQSDSDNDESISQQQRRTNNLQLRHWYQLRKWKTMVNWGSCCHLFLHQQEHKIDNLRQFKKTVTY